MQNAEKDRNKAGMTELLKSICENQNEITMATNVNFDPYLDCFGAARQSSIKQRVFLFSI